MHYQQYLSLDPFLTDKLRDPSIDSYVPAYTIGKPITSAGIARVIRSSHPSFPPSTLLLADDLPFAEYTTLTASTIASQLASGTLQPLSNPHNLPLPLFLGPLGMPGLTAYSSLQEIAHPRAGETIFISSAAGAVGQMVGQLALRLGLRVLGSVGTNAKLDYITAELGFHGGFNYRTEEAGAALARLAPEGVDIYFDNVGGAQLDAALAAMRVGGRIVACGMITAYNKPLGEGEPVRNLLCVVDKRLLMRGFIVFDEEFGLKWRVEHQEKVGAWLAEGSVKGRIHVVEGLEGAVKGLVELFDGGNFGKAVVRVGGREGDI